MRYKGGSFLHCGHTAYDDNRVKDTALPFLDTLRLALFQNFSNRHGCALPLAAKRTSGAANPKMLPARPDEANMRSSKLNDNVMLDVVHNQSAVPTARFPTKLQRWGMAQLGTAALYSATRWSSFRDQACSARLPLSRLQPQ